jgi:hypothetical protein
MRRPDPEGIPRGRAHPAVLFLAALAAGFACGGLAMLAVRRGGVEDPGPMAGSRPPAVLPQFTDVTDSAGIRFKHEAGNKGKYYYPEVMGAGCAFFDYDGDGNLDIYFVNGNLLPPEAPSPEIQNALYRNNGDGTFTDVTAKAGVGDPSYGQGCCAADYDGDGDQDLYVTNYGPNVLYRNKGDGTFEKVDGIWSDPGWGQSCAFFDADGDGDLDLYLQNYLNYSLQDHKDWPVTIGGEKVLDYCDPQGYFGQDDRLFRNEGNGAFVDVTRESGIVGRDGTGMGLACADMDGDGDPDIVIANDTRPNFYYENAGQGKFVEKALAAGLAYNAEGNVEAFMGVDVGDFDGDQLLDVAIPSLRTEGFNLFKNLGSMFSDVSVTSGLDAATSAYTGFAPVFIDDDSDGDLDLFFTAGEVRMGRTPAGTSSSFEERYAMTDLLIENKEGRFANISAFAGDHFKVRRIHRSCSAGDYDNDGDLDLLVTAMGGKPALLRNDTRGGNWIGFKLQGKAPNLDAVGARVWLTAGGRTQLREIHAGGSYLGQRDRRLLFGLGSASRVEKVRVRWSGGQEQTYGELEIQRYHTLRQAEPKE